ncbi:hypothetical protein [Actinacidiphila rubida]|uniref:ABC transporter permease n=1 Tax=Actinacidiphila rubida TaxID=310780 RepID=A0A1H8KMV2_9ACTN|nr:hypothetical protein [Actinacidiphila rubida]SEN94184.1 hypothetical protein SAMN05216267_1013101 [Actinacidiphila rubida]
MATRSLPPRARSVLLIVVLSALAAFLLWAFTWPAARSGPRDLPLGVAGPGASVTRIEAGLAGHEGTGAFAFHRYADADAARRGIEHRVVYGAIVARPDGLHVLTASAASPAVATMLQQVAAQLPGGPAPVTDVVALPSADPRGGAFASSVLPTIVAGLALGAFTLAVRSVRLRLLTLVLGAAAVGAVVAGIGNTWLGLLDGRFAADAGVAGLIVLAVGSAVSGLGALLGARGIGVGSVLFMMLGNAWSGVTSAPEFLPGPVRTIGRLLPPGAGAEALRSAAFFHGHGLREPVLVLAGWAVLGLVLTTAGHAAGRRTPPVKVTAVESPARPVRV